MCPGSHKKDFFFVIPLSFFSVLPHGDPICPGKGNFLQPAEFLQELIFVLQALIPFPVKLPCNRQDKSCFRLTAVHHIADTAHIPHRNRTQSRIWRSSGKPANLFLKRRRLTPLQTAVTVHPLEAVFFQLVPFDYTTGMTHCFNIWFPVI